MRYKKACVAALAAGAVSLVGMASAGADPTGAKKGEVLSISCDTLGPLDIAINGNGAWTPAHDTNSNLVLTPYEFHETFTFTPTGGDPQTSSDDMVKNAPNNGRLDTCSFHEEFSDSSGSFVVDGTALVSYTNAK